MYGKLIEGVLEYAPLNYKTEEGNLILNFDKNEELMIAYGYKLVIKKIPNYDVNTENLYVSDYIENENDIVIIYEKVAKEDSIAKKIAELEHANRKLNNQLNEINATVEDNINNMNTVIETVNQVENDVRILENQQNSYSIILSEEVNK